MSRKKSFDLDQLLQRLVLFSMFLPLVVVSLTAIGAVGLWGEQIIKKEQLQRAQSIARTVENYLDQASKSLETVARVAKKAPSATQTVMQGTWEACGYFDTLSRLSADGRTRLLVPQDPRFLNLDMSNLPYFKKHENQHIKISSPFISIYTGNPTVYLSRRLPGQRLMVGELNLGALQNAISALQNAPVQNTIFLLDQSGMLLAHPAFDLVRQQSNLADSIIFRQGSRSAVSLIYQSGKKWVLGSSALIKQTGWVVVVQAPLFTAFKSFIWALALTLAASLAIWLLLVSNLRTRLNQRVARPLAQLNQGVSALAKADFDKGRSLAGIPVSFSELTALSENFQQMADAIEVRQTALQASEKDYRDLFERLPVPLFRSTPSGQFLNVNAAFVAMMGFPDSETLLKFNSTGRYADPAQREQWRIIAERDGIVSDYEFKMLRFDGSTIWVWFTCRTIRDSQGDILFYEGNIKDVTERKKLEEQVRHSQKMEAVGQLAGGVAHDFNNILSVIIGYSELMLLDMADKDPLRGKIQEIHQAGIRSMELTGQLLGFARKQTIKPEVLDLNHTLQGMLNLLNRLIGEDIDLLWIPGTDLWPVKMDPSQIDQLLANLCVNARDAINGPGKVTIETRNIEFDAAYCTDHKGFSPGSYVMLAVSDNGCGMDKQTLNKIFEPFYTTKGPGQGTGMGLATVYGIVKQNTGFINVYSEKGHGSTFKIYLRREESEFNEITQCPAVGTILTGDETILVVEDEPAALKLTRIMLKKCGYAVLTASSPTQAIQIARDNPDIIKLLLSDVVMPEMTGRDLSENLTAHYPGLKCLFMSGYTSNVIAHQGVLDDNIDFIQKPFSYKDLAARVRKVLDA